MNWERISHWAEVSDCGRFTVAAARIGGFFKFTAWRKPVVEGEMATELGTFSNAGLARDCCERAGAP